MTNPADAETDLTAFELRRREAYRLVFGAAAAAMLPAAATAAAADAPAFLHGVASGDPQRTRVILWTRVTPPRLRNVPLTWTVATNPDMSGVVATGTVVARRERDFCAKVDAGGLQPGRTYHYQFTAPGGIASPIGTTRTLPAADSMEPFALAIFSCSNYEKGYFNAYGEAAKEASGLAAVLHLGDYIYEYGSNGYVTPALATGVVSEPRAGELDPTSEIVLLEAYNARYALYRTDPNLQALHAALPWIVIYDDHESTNDSWTDGAENHQPATEGDWTARKRAALRAYWNWMPIREPQGRQLLDPATDDPTWLYRSFRFGRLARLIMLDTRLAGRDEQLTVPQLLGLYQADAGQGVFAGDVVGGRPRSLLGATQEAWLDERLANSRAVWQIIGNQILAHYQVAADFQNSPLFTDAQKAQIAAIIDQLFGPGNGALFAQLGAAGAPNPIAADTWTGYPTAHNRLNASLAKAANPVILSGDSHNAWAANLRGVGSSGIANLGVEFGTASVTSPGLEEFFLGFPPAALAALSVQSSQTRSVLDKLQYADTARRGYIRLDVSREVLAATFVFVSTAFSTSYTVDRGTRFEVQAGARKITGT